MTEPRQDATIRSKEDKKAFREETESLWRIALGPTVWAAHFLISYAAAAIYCAKSGDAAQGMTAFRIAVGVAGLIALAALAWIGRQAWRQWNRADHRDDIHDGAVAEDRHQFLGHAALLLVIVSAVGVSYTSLPILVLGDCR